MQDDKANVDYTGCQLALWVCFGLGWIVCDSIFAWLLS